MFRGCWRGLFKGLNSGSKAGTVVLSWREGPFKQFLHRDILIHSTNQPYNQPGRGVKTDMEYVSKNVQHD